MPCFLLTPLYLMYFTFCHCFFRIPNLFSNLLTFRHSYVIKCFWPVDIHKINRNKKSKQNEAHTQLYCCKFSPRSNNFTTRRPNRLAPPLSPSVQLCNFESERKRSQRKSRGFYPPLEVRSRRVTRGRGGWLGSVECHPVYNGTPEEAARCRQMNGAAARIFDLG